MLEAGLPLPRALQREFPPELIATPIDDIDKYYQNKMVSLFNLLFYLNAMLEQFDQYIPCTSFVGHSICLKGVFEQHLTSF